MKTFLTLPLLTLILLTSCAREHKNAPSTDAKKPEEQGMVMCPIHNQAMREGPGTMAHGLSVSWDQEIHDALEKYPYVRLDTWDSEVITYCEFCEGELKKVMSSAQ